MSTTQTGAQALMDALLAAGVETLFGYPGGAIMPVYDALYHVSDRLHHVLVRHEQGAVHAAQGYARASGRTGVCLATSGPGATNLITGLTDALMDSTPLVCITGQVGSHALGTDAFQEADVIGLTLAATKWNYQITDPAEIPAILAQAFAVARAGRPGPVLIDITKDAQLKTFEPAKAPKPRLNAITQRYPTAPRDPAALARAAALINNAERPYLLVGQGVLLAGASEQVRQLAEQGGIPVASTLLGLSALPVNHPLYVGMLGMHGHYGANLMTAEADVVIAVGMRFDDRVTGKPDAYIKQAKLIHIEIDPAEVDKVVPAEVALLGDARAVLNELLPLLELRAHPDWLEQFRVCDLSEYEQVIRPETKPAAGPLKMGETVAELSRQTEGAAIVVSDVGQHQMHAARYYDFLEPQSHISSGGLGTMGFALPAAIGAQLGAAERTVVAIIGDGGFQMTIQELGTVMQERLPVKIVILNNGFLGMVRQWQELFFDRRYSFVHLDNPDFLAIAAGYRIPGARVSERAELAAAVTQMLATPGPFLLEVQVGREDAVLPMIPAGATVHDIRLSC